MPPEGPRLLVTAREGALYLERARIHVEGDRLVYHVTDDADRREFNIPHVNLAVLFMGQGCSITEAAMRLLADEGVHLASTGSGGTPMHMGSLATYRDTGHFRRLLPIYMDPARSLAAARSIMTDRAERMRKTGVRLAAKRLGRREAPEITRATTDMARKVAAVESIESLLGIEGDYAKSCYAGFAGMVGAASFRRAAGAAKNGGKGASPEDMALVNSLIDHGNYLCYGMAGAALWALGIPPHMSLFHGKTRPGGLVFDLADSFKDSLVLPNAFAALRGKGEREARERDFRSRMISAFDDHQTLMACITSVERFLDAGEAARA